VQDAGLELFTELVEDDVLFIDSSHIVRLDRDVPFLFLKVLPALRAGPLIHIHDIPFPYHCPYPAEYWIYKSVWPMWWNESMLLHALLCGNKQFAVILSTPLIRHHDEAFLKQLIPDYQTIDEAEHVLLHLVEASVKFSRQPGFGTGEVSELTPEDRQVGSPPQDLVGERIITNALAEHCR
jgi:hypothetical protein